MINNTYLQDKEYGSEFEMIVADILNHPKFETLKQIEHHGNGLYAHSLSVAYNAYVIALKFGLDAEAVARGALLHDFFFEDWRKADTSSRKGLDKIREMHGFSHPKKALANAQKYFDISEKEADMIVKHMFPLTLNPPKYRESWVVTCVDKGVAIKEMLQENTPRKIYRRLVLE